MADLRKSLENSMKVQKIENAPQLTTEVASILNAQITNEHQSAQIYFAISAYLDDKGWNNAGKLFLKYGHEEMSHMRKIQEYMYDRNNKVTIQPITAVQSEYVDIRGALSTALQHEIQVTQNWNNIACTARDCGDYTTMHFAKWFLDEQVEEEDKFRSLLDLLNLGIPNWELDNHVIKDML